MKYSTRVFGVLLVALLCAINSMPSFAAPLFGLNKLSNYRDERNAARQAGNQAKYEHRANTYGNKQQLRSGEASAVKTTIDQELSNIQQLVQSALGSNGEMDAYKLVIDAGKRLERDVAQYSKLSASAEKYGQKKVGAIGKVNYPDLNGVPNMF